MAPRFLRGAGREIHIMSMALECIAVSKVFSVNGKLLGRGGEKIEAVKRVTLEVKAGEIFGILGPNGSGKSTLIRLIATLLLPDDGQIRVFGHDVTREPIAVRRLLNRVSVEAAFFKKLSSWENLCYAARLYGIPTRQARRDAVRILGRLGLEEKKLDVSMETMSRGMQQKVAIARALISNPRMLLLDEPTTGLDPRSKREVQGFVRELWQGQGTTVLLTTHDMAEADNLCARVAMMYEGRVVALDTPDALKKTYCPGQQNATLDDVFFAITGMEWEEVL